MKALKALQWSSLVFLTLAISCTEENKDVPDVSPYKWKESQMSPDRIGPLYSAEFEVGDDGFLYTWGTLAFSGQRGLFKYTGTTWVNIVDPNTGVLDNVLSITIFQGSVYFHAFDKLYKFENGLTTEILSGNLISDVEVFNNHLIISGEGIELSNDNYTIVTYDGNSFQPISKEPTLSKIISTNNNAYIPGFPGFVYDGQNLDLLDYYGYFFAVDEEESIYFGDSFDQNFTMEKTLNSGQSEVVGNIIHDIGIPQEMVFYDGTIMVVGVEDQSEFSSTYFLDDQEWIQVPTEHFIYDVVVFDNRLLSISLDGKIFELIKK